MVEEEGHYVSYTVPAGAVVTVEGELDGNRLVEVLWSERRVMMFLQDLRSRSVPVD